MLKGKIHRARITQCDIDYEGSLEIDSELLKEANILPREKILVANRDNGSRLETYAIPGEAGSKRFCLNGPAARKVCVGDVVVIISYCSMDFEDAKHFKPWILFPDKDNRI